ncbi:MAG: glycoside hydrolase family 38 C-terminal domain-containing protein [bacterium]
MKHRIVRVILFLLVFGNFVLMNAQTEFPYHSDFLSGFEKGISGETLDYYAIGSQSIDALLVRSMDAMDFIQWETQPVPAESKETILVFATMASLQVTSDSHRFDVYLNGTKYFSFSNPTEKSLNTITISGLNNTKMEFTNLEYDRFEDLTGFLYFHLPSKEFATGKPIRIKIVGESAQSRSWFMVFKHDCRSNISLASENVILNTTGTPKQSMRVKVFHFTSPGKAAVKIGDTETEFDLKFGFNHFNAALEKIEVEKELPIEVKVNGEVIGRTTNVFKPVKPITIYLVPHSHVDIGYTHVQDEVKKVQWKNIEDAIDISEQTAHYPEGSQFKWNTEVLWALDSYLDSVDPQKRNRLITSIQKGRIGIDGLYANILTGLCSPEEWIRMAEIIQKINDACSIKIESAMISDIPGWSWSIVPMLANSGIKYLSCGINPGDRIGSIRTELGDKPFYWISPSGKEKILTWVHEQGYAAFHYVGKAGTVAGISIIEPTIANYTNKLSDDKFPYDMTVLRYTIGGDNGTPDKYLADNVKQWNEKYLSPKLIISTNVEFFRDFEKNYGSQLPELKGDLTPYWEDGAASSPFETAINRQSADKLTRAAYLLSQYYPSSYPTELFKNAWRNVLLYDEHTWGSWNSISEPESDFTKQQWKIKQTFALDGARQAEDISELALNTLSAQTFETDEGKLKSGHVNSMEVINALPIEVTDLVNVPEILSAQLKEGFGIVNVDGETTLHQELSDGSIVFLASKVPALGSKRYFIEEVKIQPRVKPVSINSTILENEFMKLELDAKKGAINKMMLTGSDKNLVDVTNKWSLGEYLYVNGRKPDNPLSTENVTVNIKETGPLVSSWHIKSNAPGCDSYEQEIKLVAGLNRVEFDYTFDKQKIYTPEAIRIAFPFNVPGGNIIIENAFGYYRPEAEQIKGSCKNFFTMNNYVDISNHEFGISLLSPDTPIVEIGDLTNDAKVIGWLDRCAEGNPIYSFLMNNYWHTNYRATMEGKSSYRYFFYPHKEFNSSESTARGILAEQPLTVIPVNNESPNINPLLQYENENVFIVSMQPIEKGKSVWIALYNASNKQTEVELKFSTNPDAIFASDMLKNTLGNADSSFSIPGKGLKFLFVEW